MRLEPERPGRGARGHLEEDDMSKVSKEDSKIPDECAFLRAAIARAEGRDEV